MPKNKLLTAVHLFLIKDNQILMLRRFNTGYEDGNYSVVAGHVDPGESVSQAMAREAMEEAGIIISPNSLEVVQVMNRKAQDERIDFFLSAKAWKGEPRIMEKNKCDDLSWFDINLLPENTIPYIKKAIRNYQDRFFYCEFGWGRQG
ncbi:MAG: NUDIX domain-containing protein [Candidatus Moranbacteria bacterium]|nr:NUDIX domain-containing protein [Candidatus Moranbacteria bacterium]